MAYSSERPLRVVLLLRLGFPQVNRLALVIMVWCCAGCIDRPADKADLLDRALTEATLVDLTHTFDSTTVYWPTAAEGFVLERGFEGYTDQGYYYAAHSFRSAEHGGTHLDAPIHFFEGRWTADSISLRSLVAPAAVIDISSQARGNSDYELSVTDIENWERRHGSLENGAILLVRSGFAAYWPDRDRYMGTSDRGAAAVANLHFPGISPEASKWLVDNRRVGAVGIDTPSIDYGQSTLFETHRTLFEHNIPAFENVASLERLPPTGAWVVALPMKIGGGSGGPLRIVAVLP